MPLFGCSVIVNPDGEIVAETRTEEDELVVHACDLDATRFGKETIFDFKRHRRIEHYGRDHVAGRRDAAAGGLMPDLSLNFADLEPRQRYKLLCGLVVPRPIALVTTLSARAASSTPRRSRSSTCSRRTRR